jgi:hypothetical protein
VQNTNKYITSQSITKTTHLFNAVTKGRLQQKMMKQKLLPEKVPLRGGCLAGAFDFVVFGQQYCGGEVGEEDEEKIR